MGLLKKLPDGFLKKNRTKISKNIDEDIIPIKWSKEVITGKKKAIVKLAKQSGDK